MAYGISPSEHSREEVIAAITAPDFPKPFTEADVEASRKLKSDHDQSGFMRLFQLRKDITRHGKSGNVEAAAEKTAELENVFAAQNEGHQTFNGATLKLLAGAYDDLADALEESGVAKAAAREARIRHVEYKTLALQTSGMDGHILANHAAREVPEGSYGTSDSTPVGTDIIQACVVAVFSDPVTGKTTLAHVNQNTDVGPSFVRIMGKYDGDVGVTLIGAYKSNYAETQELNAVSEDNLNRVVDGLARFGNITISAAYVGHSKPEHIAENVVADPETGAITPALPGKRDRTDSLLRGRMCLLNEPQVMGEAFDTTQDAGYNTVHLNRSQNTALTKLFEGHGENYLSRYVEAKSMATAMSNHGSMSAMHHYRDYLGAMDACALMEARNQAVNALMKDFNTALDTYTSMARSSLISAGNGGYYMPGVLQHQVREALNHGPLFVGEHHLEANAELGHLLKTGVLKGDGKGGIEARMEALQGFEFSRGEAFTHKKGTGHGGV